MVGLKIYLSILMQIVILLFWLALMCFLLWIAFLVVQTDQETRRRYHPQPTTRRQTKKNTPLFQSKRPSSDTASYSQQWKELVTLVQGDTATADRLIDGERRRNPERSSEWCVDKVLWQLKRDRR
ncbi:hypothetical protein NIES25_48550 [Nostoc linckia NIES-25]|nr:hypothetical protein NIES25_48550 [Nostoc linckia NIES-25]